MSLPAWPVWARERGQGCGCPTGYPKQMLFPLRTSRSNTHLMVTPPPAAGPWPLLGAPWMMYLPFKSRCRQAKKDSPGSMLPKYSTSTHLQAKFRSGSLTRKLTTGWNIWNWDCPWKPITYGHHIHAIQLHIVQSSFNIVPRTCWTLNKYFWMNKWMSVKMYNALH